MNSIQLSVVALYILATLDCNARWFKDRDYSMMVVSNVQKQQQQLLLLLETDAPYHLCCYVVANILCNVLYVVA